MKIEETPHGAERPVEARVVPEWHAEPAPTHRCTICGAMWRYWPNRDTGADDSWNLRSTACGPCCDCAPMSEQIVPATMGDMLKWLQARLAVDAMTQHLHGPAPTDASH